jgi:hypothetical protein
MLAGWLHLCELKYIKNILNCSLFFQSFLLIHACSVFISATKSDTERKETVGGFSTRDEKSFALFPWLSSFTDSEQLAISLCIALIMFAVRDINSRKGQDSNFILSWIKCH